MNDRGYYLTEAGRLAVQMRRQAAERAQRTDEERRRLAQLATDIWGDDPTADPPRAPLIGRLGAC